jgi:hypothetical protein
MIPFRLFSLNNLNYKWTLYRKYDSGQEELVESSPIDLTIYVKEHLP